MREESAMRSSDEGFIFRNQSEKADHPGEKWTKEQALHRRGHAN